MRAGIKAKSFLGVLIVLALCELATAQEQPRLTVGSRVRVFQGEAVGAWPKSQLHTGRLLVLSEGAIVLAGESGSRTIPRSDIHKMQVSVRPSRRGTGALIGTVLGAVTGVALAVSIDDDESDWDFTPMPETAIFFGIGCAGFGALAGALIAPGEQWVDVPDTRLGLQLRALPALPVTASLTIPF